MLFFLLIPTLHFLNVLPRTRGTSESYTFLNRVTDISFAPIYISKINFERKTFPYKHTHSRVIVHILVYMTIFITVYTTIIGAEMEMVRYLSYVPGVFKARSRCARGERLSERYDDEK